MEERLGSGSSGVPALPTAAKEGWRPFPCYPPAWCECRIARQAAEARALARTAGDILQGSQESATTFPTLRLSCSCSSFIASVLCLAAFPSRFQGGLCRRASPHFPAACGFAVPCHPRTLGQVAWHVQRETSSPNFPPSSKGSSYFHRACHCHYTNERFHSVGLQGGKGLLAEAGVGTAPTGPGWVARQQG